MVKIDKSMDAAKVDRVTELKCVKIKGHKVCSINSMIRAIPSSASASPLPSLATPALFAFGGVHRVCAQNLGFLNPSSLYKLDAYLYHKIHTTYLLCTLFHAPPPPSDAYILHGCTLRQKSMHAHALTHNAQKGARHKHVIIRMSKC